MYYVSICYEYWLLISALNYWSFTDFSHIQVKVRRNSCWLPCFQPMHWCLQSTPRISDAVVPGWDPSISTSNKFPDTAAAVQDTTLWDSLKEKNYRPDTVRCSSCSPFSQHSQLYFLSAEEDMFSFHRLVWTLLPSFPIHGQKWKSLALSD